MAFAYKEPAISSADPRALLGLEPAHQPEPSLARGSFGLSARMIMLLSLVLVDALAAQVAFHFGAQLYAALAGHAEAASGFSTHLSAMALTLPIGYLFLDVYRVHGQAPIERFPVRIKATCLLFALLVGWQYATEHVVWPVGAAALSLVLVLLLMLMGESVVRTMLIRWRLWGLPTVIIGAGPTGQQVVRVLQQMPELGLRPVGFFDDSYASAGPSPALIENVPVLGAIADSARYSRRIETAIVTTPADTQETVDALATQLGYRDIIVVPDLRELPTLWVRTRDLNGLIGLQMRRNLLLRRNRLLKQTIDHLVRCRC